MSVRQHCKGCLCGALVSFHLSLIEIAQEFEALDRGRARSELTKILWGSVRRESARTPQNNLRLNDGQSSTEGPVEGTDDKFKKCSSGLDFWPKRISPGKNQ